MVIVLRRSIRKRRRILRSASPRVTLDSLPRIVHVRRQFGRSSRKDIDQIVIDRDNGDFRRKRDANRIFRRIAVVIGRPRHAVVQSRRILGSRPCRIVIGNLFPIVRNFGRTATTPLALHDIAEPVRGRSIQANGISRTRRYRFLSDLDRRRIQKDRNFRCIVCRIAIIVRHPDNALVTVHRRRRHNGRVARSRRRRDKTVSRHTGISAAPFIQDNRTQLVARNRIESNRILDAHRQRILADRYSRRIQKDVVNRRIHRSQVIVIRHAHHAIPFTRRGRSNQRRIGL